MAENTYSKYKDGLILDLDWSSLEEAKTKDYPLCLYRNRENGSEDNIELSLDGAKWLIAKLSKMVNLLEGVPEITPWSEMSEEARNGTNEIIKRNR